MGLDAEPGLPGASRQIDTSQSWVGDRRSKMMGGSIRMGRHMRIRKGSQRGPVPEQQEDGGESTQVSHSMCQGPGAGTSVRGSTNSSEMTRHLD